MSKAKKFIIPLLIVALMCSIMFAFSGCVADEDKPSLTIKGTLAPFAYDDTHTKGLTDYFEEVGYYTLEITYDSKNEDEQPETFNNLRDFYVAGGSIMGFNPWSKGTKTLTLTYKNASATVEYTVE